MIRNAAAALLFLHGMVHFAGAAHAFGLPTYPALVAPSSPPLGLAWAVAGLLTLGAAGAVRLLQRDWWVFSAAAALVSQGAIVCQWTDARSGSVVNVIVLGAATVAAHVYRERGASELPGQHWRWPWGG